MNRIILIGNIGNDPEIVNLESGTKIAKFSLATPDNYKDKNGQKIEQTDWHSITVFGKLADIVEKYFKKGNKVMVEGKSKTRSYETKDGDKRYVTEIIMDGFEFLTSKNTSESTTPEAPIAKPQSNLNQEEEDDSLPF